MLHVATDWPGHFQRVAESISLLVAAGADVNAGFVGGHAESPLHWAASSDDVDALDALLDAGADIEAPGSVLGGGAPLADACSQWNAARRLVERGASTRLKDAAALGMMDRVEAYFAAGSPDAETVTSAFWSASKGLKREAAQYLIDRGGDVNWIGWNDQTCLDIALEVYTTDVDLPFEHYGVLASRLGAAGVAPTTTMLGVTRLAIPVLMVELEGTAVA
jgi:uncharacterized protein